MADLYLGIVIVLVASLLGFLAAWKLSRSWDRGWSDGLALLTVCFLFLYIRFVWYQPQLVRYLPVASLVIVGNWFPILAAVLAGVGFQRLSGGWFRRGTFVAGLMAASVTTLVWPILGEAPRCGDRWSREGICLQTNPSTCTPACAATLLRQHGIDANEQEMAELCLTRQGTTWQGLYHGLKRKAAGTGWDVEVIQCEAEQLGQLAQHPLILNVGLPSTFTEEDPTISVEWGWKPGVGHSVVLLKSARHGRIVIADPTPGIECEEWTPAETKLLFRGTAMRLVRR